MFNYTVLTNHMETHLNENNSKTSEQEALKKHNDSIHNQMKSHKCPICDFTFSKKYNLKQHIDSIHNELKPHKCHICDYTASQKTNLKRHIDSIHNQLQPHKVSNF